MPRKFIEWIIRYILYPLEEFMALNHPRIIQKPKEAPVTQTLILLFHPDIEKSKANAALQSAAHTVPDTLVVDMQKRYPDGVIDMHTVGAAEARALLEADRIVLQFPVQWYSTPPLLKAWQDAVLTRMCYIHADTEGDKLAGTPLMIAATAGNTPDAYGRGGANHFTMDELMAPLKATAMRCGLPWHPPHLVFRADRLDQTELAAAGDSYVRALEAFIAATPAHNRKAA
jgi:putative NADPH-quinone reductase